MLWLSLYPLDIGGLMSDRTRQFQWSIDDTPMGLRWRSVRTSLGASGSDLSRVEHIEFWTLADTSAAKRATNPRLVIDIGDVSENSVAFGPVDLTVTPVSPGVNDSVFKGKGLMGYDVLNSERDSLSRAFNQATDDRGLPGDVASLLNVFDENGFTLAANVPLCARGVFRVLLLGDARANCTVQNGRLDEEDVDQDYVLNLTEAQREQERVLRYIVDLADPASYNRIGRCNLAAFDTTGGGFVTSTDVCWVQVRVPFRAPADSLNGGPNIRRVRMMRLTMVSGDGQHDSAFTQLPLARLRFVGSPWIKRSDRAVRGIAGDDPAQGFVITSVIGTQDRDTLRGIDYEPPPGVTDEAERQQTGLEGFQTQINER
jgi:cell surface protein SprA